MNIDRNSWHHQVALKGGFESFRNVTFCSYFWHVLFGAFLLALMFAATILVLSGVIDIGMVLALGLKLAELQWYGFVTFVLIGVVFLAVVIIAGAFFLVNGGGYARYKIQDALRDREPGFLRTAYRAFKNKVCPLVNIQ